MKDKISILLRIGIAFTFLYAAGSAILNPSSWIGFIPIWLRNIIDENILIMIHHTVNIILGLWLLSGKKVFYASILSALSLFSIIIFNMGAFDIVFRDVGVLFAAIALAVMHYKK